MYKLTEARVRLVRDLKRLALPIGKAMATRTPAEAVAADEILHQVEQLKVEARVVWGTQLAVLVSKVQKGTNDLVRYVCAKLADDTSALIAYVTTDDELDGALTMFDLVQADQKSTNRLVLDRQRGQDDSTRGLADAALFSDGRIKRVISVQDIRPHWQ